MNKDEKISTNKMDSLLKFAAEKTGADLDTMKSAISNGNINDLLGAFRPEDSEKVQELLSDEDSRNKLLSSPQVQAIMKKFLGNDSNK